MNQLNHPTQLAPEPSGQGKEVGWFRQIVKNLRERTVRVGPGLRVSYKTDCTLIELRGATPSAAGGDQAGIKRCRIIEQFSNYLTTNEYDSAGQITDIFLRVAIPFYLRGTTYGSATPGVTVQIGGFNYVTVAGQIRCSSVGVGQGYVVKQFFPPYLVGKDIYAIQPIGGTDVTGSVAGQSFNVDWMDANVDGRRLDTLQVELPMCRLEGGVVVQRHVTVEGGPIY